MKIIRKAVKVLTILLFSSFFIQAHTGHGDPVYAELNDYLMAIQIMRYEDPRAEIIFSTWNELREESWKIRELTDDQNFLINSRTVMDQITVTRKKQKQLLKECKAYFIEVMQKEPSIQFDVNNTISVDWKNPLFNVQIGHSKVLLIAIKNHRKVPVQLIIKTKPSEEILFWNNQFTLQPNSTRYSFVVCSPLSIHVSSNIVKLTNSIDGRSAFAEIKINGIPTTEAPYKLIPGELPTKVILPQKRGRKYKKSEIFSDAIKLSIVDEKTGKPLSVRINVNDENGKSFWFPLDGPALAINRNIQSWNTTLWKNQPGPYFYMKGEAILGVNPHGKMVTINHGFEYNPISISVPESGVVEVTMHRWIDMPNLGWYSGQTHIHTTDVGIPVQFSKYWPLVSQAEDLHVSTILTLKGEWETHAIYANEFPMGERKSFSTNEHIIAYGQEYRNNPYGHVALIGLDHLIQPISSGALGELGGPDYPPNAIILDEALSQGANTIAAHFGIFVEKIDTIKTPWPSTGFEMPADIALGKIQLAEIYGNGGQLETWYDILNCGFRIPATAGPDWMIKNTPRVYVYLGEEPFTFENWRAKLQKGQSFITTGPMLFLEVNGQKPGSQININKNSRNVYLNASAKTPKGNIPLEIVFNGKVIAMGIEINMDIALEDSGWITVRCEGAHSNPIYITYEGRPAGFAAPAKKFINSISQLENWVNEKGLFYNKNQKAEVLEVLNKGKSVYKNIITQAEILGRK